MDTQQRVYVTFAIALAACLPAAVIGAALLAIFRDGEAVGQAFDFFKSIADIVSVVLGGLGVTHLVVSNRQPSGSAPTPSAASAPEPAPGA